MPTPPTGKPLGRPPGSKSKKDLENKELKPKNFTEVNRAAFEEAKKHLTHEQIEAMKPLDIMHFAQVFYFEQGFLQLSVGIAKELAPYLHAKRAPIADIEEERNIKITGGLPEDNKSDTFQEITVSSKTVAEEEIVQ